MDQSHYSSKDFLKSFCDLLESENLDFNVTENNDNDPIEATAISNISELLEDIQFEENIPVPASPGKFKYTFTSVVEDNENDKQNPVESEVLLNISQNMQYVQSDQNNYESANIDNCQYKVSIANENNDTIVENSIYICNECGENFEDKQNLIEHVTMHNVTKELEEIMSNTDNVPRSNVNSEIDKHSDLIIHDFNIKISEDNHIVIENVYICDLCGISFDEKIKLVAHISIHNITKRAKRNTNGHSCLICDMLFETKSELINHDIYMHDSDVEYVACNDCDFKSYNKGNLIAHIKTHCLNPVQCQICKSEFSRNSSLKLHIMRIHAGERPHQCAVCPSKFSERHKLMLHMKTHSDYKPFKCDICQTKFKRNDSLKHHLTIHSGIRAYGCEICSMTFRTNADLRNHKKVHTGERPYKCNICPSQFSKGNKLKLHMRIHSGEKPFECGECDAKFRVKDKLKDHMKIHTGEKPFKCDVCGSGFITGSRLRCHMRTHSDEKLFECDMCVSKFKDSRALKLHKMRFHFKKKD